MKVTKRLLVIVVVGLAALVLNPFFGCDRDVEFRYGADEMRAVVEGTWKLTVPARDTAPAHEYVFSISQAGAPSQQQSRRTGVVTTATACAHRSLVKAANACLDYSEMPLDVRLLAGDGSPTGTLRVVGTTFHVAELKLAFGEAAYAHARLAPNGAVLSVRLNSHDEVPASVLVRVATAHR